MAKQKKKRNPNKLGPKLVEKKTKKKAEKPSEKPADVTTMTHVQVISRQRELTTKETADCGGELATKELQLDQVRKEKKESDREFDNTIKDHLSNIMRLSLAIDTGIMTTNVECEVVLDRAKEKKTCYPKDGSESFVLPMTTDDFDLLT